MQFANWELFVSKLAEMPSRIGFENVVIYSPNAQAKCLRLIVVQHGMNIDWASGLICTHAIYDGVFVIRPSWTNFWVYFPLMVTLLTTEGPQ